MADPIGDTGNTETAPRLNPSWSGAVETGTLPPPLPPVASPTTVPVGPPQISVASLGAAEPSQDGQGGPTAPTSQPTAPQPISVQRPDPVPVATASSASVSTPQPAIPGQVPPELSINQPPKKTVAIPWRGIIIGLIIVAILAGGTFALGFFGILFGPPQNAQTALVKASQQLLAQGGYHISGSGVLTVTPSAGQSAQLPLTFTGDRVDTTTGQIKLSLDLTTLPANTLPTTVPNLVEIDIRRINGKVYVQSPILSTLLNLPVTNQFIELPDAQSIIPPITKDQALQIAPTGSRIGFERIGTDQTARYDVTINLEQLLAAARPDILTSQLGSLLTGSQVTGSFWIGLLDGLPRQVNFAGTTSGATPLGLTLNGQLIRFGQPDPVVAPQASEIVIVSQSELAFSALGQTLQKKARDTQRKAHIDSLKVALDLFKKDQGSFPNTAGSIIKTSDADTVLKSLVDQGYLQILPLDPLDPQFWYGYKSSDGTSYEIRSVLEDIKDPQGIDRDGFHLYILTDQTVAVSNPVGTTSTTPSGLPAQ